MRRIMTACFAMVLVFTVGCSSSSSSTDNPGNPGTGGSEQATTTIGTSSTGSTYNIIAVGMADILQRNASVGASAITTGGTDATLRAIGDKKADFGLITSWAMKKAYEGTEPFEKAVDVRQVLQGQETGVYLVARADRNINTPADLAGKTLIGERPALRSVDEFTYALLDLYGVKKEDVKIVQTAESTETINALKQGTVDAAVIPGGINAPHIKELAETLDVTFVKIDRIEELLTHPQITGGGFLSVNPPGTFKGQTEEVPFLSYGTILGVHADISEDLVYTVTKTLIENHNALVAVHPTGRVWTIENTLSNPQFSVPYHPGAVKYFKEAGKWTDEMEKRQQEIMKK